MSNNRNQKNLTETQAHPGTEESAEILLTMSHDVLVEIFKFLRPEIILSSFALVSKHFSEIIKSSNPLWQFKQAQHFPLTKVVPKENQTALTVFKSNYQSAYKKEEAYLFSCVKEGDVEALKKSKITLDQFFLIKDQSKKNLFDWAVLLKQQTVLNHVYELARINFVNQDGKDVDVKKTDPYEKSLLFWAAQTNQVDKIIPLITADANPNQARTNDGATPLYIAAYYGHLEVVKALLGAGADINQAKTNDGATPLYVAAWTGHLEMVKTMLGAGADINQGLTHNSETPLYIAAQNGHLEVVKALLRACADINLGTTYEGSTPLHIAAYHGHLASVQELLKAKGIDPNQARTNDGATPLYIAAQNGHLEVVKALLGAGADIIQGLKYDSKTPLYIAAQNGHLEVVKTMLEKGVQIDKANVNLLKNKFKNPILELKPANTLKEGVVFINPANASQLSHEQLNSFLILALEKADQFLTQVKQNYKKALVIRDLINLIYTDIHKSFSDHVENWKSQVSTHDKTMTNQMIISDHEKPASKVAKSLSEPVISFVGFFSESTAKTLDDKTKTDTEILIERLVEHSVLWSSHDNLSKNTASSSIGLIHSSSGQ